MIEIHWYCFALPRQVMVKKVHQLQNESSIKHFYTIKSINLKRSVVIKHLYNLTIGTTVIMYYFITVDNFVLTRASNSLYRNGMSRPISLCINSKHNDRVAGLRREAGQCKLPYAGKGGC